MFGMVNLVASLTDMHDGRMASFRMDCLERVFLKWTNFRGQLHLNFRAFGDLVLQPDKQAGLEAEIPTSQGGIIWPLLEADLHDLGRWQRLGVDQNLQRFRIWK